jgi:hypothetical protein
LCIQILQFKLLFQVNNIVQLLFSILILEMHSSNIYPSNNNHYTSKKFAYCFQRPIATIDVRWALRNQFLRLRPKGARQRCHCLANSSRDRPASTTVGDASPVFWVATGFFSFLLIFLAGIPASTNTPGKLQLPSGQLLGIAIFLLSLPKVPQKFRLSNFDFLE